MKHIPENVLQHALRLVRLAIEEECESIHANGLEDFYGSETDDLEPASVIDALEAISDMLRTKDTV